MREQSGEKTEETNAMGVHDLDSAILRVEIASSEPVAMMHSGRKNASLSSQLVCGGIS